jgi:hypothetical protein
MKSNNLDSPKFNLKDKFNVFSTELGSKFALLCPAQGSPLPAFRWFFLDSNTKNSYKIYFDFIYQNQSGVQHLKSMLEIKQILLVWLNPRNLQFYVLLKDPPYQHSGENLTGVFK